MRTAIRTTINKKPIRDVVKDNRKRAPLRDAKAREVVVDKIRSYYKKKVNTKKYTDARRIIDTVFTLEDLGIENRYDNKKEFLAAVRKNSTLKTRLTTLMTEKINDIFSSGSVDNKKLFRKLNVQHSQLDIQDLNIQAFEDPKKGVRLKVNIKPKPRERIVKTIFRSYKKDHDKIANEAIKALSKYISGLKAKGSNKDYIRRLESIASELSVSKAIVYITSVGAEKTGDIEYTLSNLPRFSDIISAQRWTALVRKRLNQTTENWDRRTNPARPPWFKKRSGKFISSVKVEPNYREARFKLSYIDYYKRNKKYGYKPDEQIEAAVRYVATELQDEVARRFSFGD